MRGRSGASSLPSSASRPRTRSDLTPDLSPGAPPIPVCPLGSAPAPHGGGVLELEPWETCLWNPNSPLPLGPNVQRDSGRDSWPCPTLPNKPVLPFSPGASLLCCCGKGVFLAAQPRSLASARCIPGGGSEARVCPPSPRRQLPASQPSVVSILGQRPAGPRGRAQGPGMTGSLAVGGGAGGLAPLGPRPRARPLRLEGSRSRCCAGGVRQGVRGRRAPPGPHSQARADPTPGSPVCRAPSLASRGPDRGGGPFSPHREGWGSVSSFGAGGFTVNVRNKRPETASCSPSPGLGGP